MLLEIDGSATAFDSEGVRVRTEEILREQDKVTPLTHTPLATVYAEAQSIYPQYLGLSDILSIQDFADAEKRVGEHVANFNRRYGLDGWDYAIASSCGLFAAMLDILCVSAPPKPTLPFNQRVDGLFNGWVQKAFNDLIPADLSKVLSEGSRIGAPDSSNLADLIGAPEKAINPTNHRLRSLAHDPLLGLIFGVLDMIHGTCTTVVDGRIIRILSKKNPTEGTVFQLIGRMFGHLLSDMNAPSGKGNRGMGLPAPFMGLLRMFEGIPVGDSTFGRQIEWMFVNGYDFRQFVTTSVPMLIMETLLRAFYTVKQMKLYGASFSETMLDTVPTRMNPRFRMILAIAYGTSSSVNAGKMYITGNILNANYASWMGLTWNGFHSLKWALLERHLKLWEEVEKNEINSLENLVARMDDLEKSACRLPI